MTANTDGRPTGYLAEFSEVLGRFEITTRNGDAVSVDEGIGAMAEWLLALKHHGGKALLIGNGGSAAIVSHVHNDLCKAVGVRAIVFNEPPLLTALANDDGYPAVFHKPVDLWADRGDLLIAVSSSGESENIVTAAALARDKGARLLTMTGFKAANRLRQLGDLNVYVPAARYGYVEMAHSVIAHCITDLAVARAAASV
jgi:D-sedoheptulose 7-phosphate isomerase